MLFEVDPAAVRRRLRAGADLWDGTILYAADFSPDPLGGSVVTAGACNYYAYVTVADRIQGALLNPSKPSHQALLEGHLSNFLGAVSSEALKPVGVAASTTCVFETGDGPRLLLTKRSEEVINALGTYCVIPTFGLESPTIDGVRSEFGTLFYNFAKEFLEEVYGQKELIQVANSESLDPDAIFESKKARSLLTQFTSGTAELRVLGVGLEPTDGTLTLALLAHFQSKDFYREVLRRAHAGWEVKRVPGERPITFLAPESGQLAGACTIETMSATSLFSVDRALRHLAEVRDAPATKHP
jgi:hypothetical protein